ncbi:bactofilin family protein [Halocola ammonii]
MARNSDPAPDMSINRIVEGTQVEGDIKSESNIRIDGKFKGTIQTKGRLVIGPTGLVEGTVVCQNAEVEGNMIGKISVDQLLTLKPTAKIDGDIFTDKLSIEAGASFTGACNMASKVKDMKDLESKSKSKKDEEYIEEKSA